MEKIAGVIFDWGGVLIDDPAPGRLRYCAEALGAGEDELAAAFEALAPLFQTGGISEDGFWEAVCGRAGVSLPISRSLWGDGFAAAYAERADMFSLAGRLRAGGIKTGVLSNTEMPAMEHFQRMNYDMFDVVVFSCAEGARKPERRIYEIAVERLKVRPAQAVFMDDDRQYVEAAKKSGLNAILFEGIEQVKSELTLLGVGWG
ncbi:MAG: HAD family phosphatase [Sedimentisphaerales bacterium]|nr:HAD family phosphatase [Sedimentisphaerales bacterium]